MASSTSSYYYGSFNKPSRKNEERFQLDNSERTVLISNIRLSQLSERDSAKRSSRKLSPIIASIPIIVATVLIIAWWGKFDPSMRNKISTVSSSSLANPSIPMMGEPNPADDSAFYHAYPRRPFITHNHQNITLPVLGFPSVALSRLSSSPNDQTLANDAVRHAIQDLQISYFDVAPEYGDGIAQERLGPALEPFRHKVFLAAKTMYRTAIASEIDLNNTLDALRTDHLNLYQFHSISTQEDVDAILGEGGAMETFQKAKLQGRIRAIGFSAHSEPMAIQMIESGLVDTCMFPINFAAYTYGNVGKGVLDAAIRHGVGVIALKAGARGRLTQENGNSIIVPDEGEMKHVPEWKRQEMLRYPVRTSKLHPTCWYEPEDDEEYLHKLILWSLNQKGVSAVLPPGDLGLLDGISDFLRGKKEVPFLEENEEEDMLERYKDVKPIFHDWDLSGTKVST